MTAALISAAAVVLGALIAGPLMWKLHRLDKHNSHQHADNGRVLGRIEDTQTQLLTLLTDHITDRDAHG